MDALKLSIWEVQKLIYSMKERNMVSKKDRLCSKHFVFSLKLSTKLQNSISS
jgi:hypothetical protein